MRAKQFGSLDGPAGLSGAAVDRKYTSNHEEQVYHLPLRNSVIQIGEPMKAIRLAVVILGVALFTSSLRANEPLYEGLGTTGPKVTAANPEAQKYVVQGISSLRLQPRRGDPVVRAGDQARSNLRDGVLGHRLRQRTARQLPVVSPAHGRGGMEEPAAGKAVRRQLHARREGPDRCTLNPLRQSAAPGSLAAGQGIRRRDAEGVGEAPG